MDALLVHLSHPVIAILLLLGLLVLVHEAGHFIVGKLCGIGVEIFSIGFGPVVAGFQRGSTHYRLSLIPLGGFVKFYGSVADEDVPDDMQGKEFHRAGLGQRFATIVAGPLANFILAVFCYFILGLNGIQHPPAFVGEVVSGSPADRAGLVFGDRVTEINGKKILYWQDLHDTVYDSPGKKLTFTVLREGKEQSIAVTPESVTDGAILPGDSHGRIGISPGRVPSVVTIEKDSPAALSGLGTGDLITGIIGPAGLVKVAYYRELDRELEGALSLGKASLTLSVRSPESAHEKTVELMLDGLSREDLGLGHSQLTIKATRDFPDQAKVKPGDRLLAFDGQEVDDVFGYARIAGDYRKPEVQVKLRRDGQTVAVGLKLKPVEIQRIEGKVTLYTMPLEFMGMMVQPESVMETYDFFGAVGYGFRQTIKQTTVVAVAIGRLFTGDMPLAALGGPISIAKVASDSVKLGWLTFLTSMALISINLGLLNLLPIPVLDGGQLVLLGCEGIMKKPLPKLAIENFQKVGFVVVLSLVVVATYNDFSRFWTSMLAGMSGFFQ